MERKSIYFNLPDIAILTSDLVALLGHTKLKFPNPRMVGTKRKAYLVSNTSMFAHVCMFCNERGLNLHLHRYCKQATDNRNRKHNIEDDPSIREDNNASTNASSFCFGIKPAEDFLISSIINSPSLLPLEDLIIRRISIYIISFK